tara:strand:+ start:397 stop:711 length:315 start_codon:yes stop_codon:yes gene_type:complete
MHPKYVTPKALLDATVKLAELGNTGATIDFKLSAISVLLRIAEEDGVIERKPELPRRKESEHRIRFIALMEEKKCLDWCTKTGELTWLYLSHVQPIAGSGAVNF